MSSFLGERTKLEEIDDALWSFEMLNLTRPDCSPSGYCILKRQTPEPNKQTAQQNAIVAVILKASPKRTPEVSKGVPHNPFEEFPMRKMDELVEQLEKTKPNDSKVEVNQMEESRHSPCMQEMVAIMVHNLEDGKNPPQIYAIYQFCASCKVGVRVL